MQIWGLTGGIASGKSTNLAQFACCGATILSADQLYHGLLHPTRWGPSPLAAAIVENLAAPQLLDSQHRLLRGLLRQLVLENPQQRQQLEALVHPAIAAAAKQALTHWANCNISLVVYEVPLLFEKAMQQQFSGTIVAWVDHITQQQRLKARQPALPDWQMQAYLQAQHSLEEKRALANYVIDNRGSRQQSFAQVVQLYERLSCLKI